VPLVDGYRVLLTRVISILTGWIGFLGLGAGEGVGGGGAALSAGSKGRAAASGGDSPDKRVTHSRPRF
jgi:hypothetical protein